MLGSLGGAGSGATVRLQLLSQGHEIKTLVKLYAQRGVCLRFFLSLCPFRSCTLLRVLWGHALLLSSNQSLKEKNGFHVPRATH